jgi:acyl-CoA synthetase (AMP-forming)/AMP-acid ligase II
MSELTTTLAALYGDRLAVILDEPLTWAASRKTRLTFRDIDDLTARCAGALTARGVTAGDRVAVATSNRPDFLLFCLAVMRLGAVAVPINHLLQTAEIEYIVSTSGARVLILDEAVHAAAFGGAWPLRMAPQVLFAQALADAPLGPPPPRVVTDADTVAAILFTSGTGGFPRGAIHTSGGLLSRLSLALLYPGSERQLVVMALPLAHIMGMIAVLLSWLAGTPVYLIPEFHPLRVLETIQRARAAMFVGVPAMYRLMADEGLDRFDLSSMRAWISSADVIDPRLVAAFRRRGARAFGIVPPVFVDTYGSVEAGGPVMARAWLGLVPGTRRPAGMLLPRCRARLLDADGRAVPRGAVGELWIQSPSTFAGYVGDAAAARPRADRWVRTGDLASRSRLGLIRFVARKDDVITSGGYSVFPEEIERVLGAHEDVILAVAFGLHDRVTGERPAAAVVLREAARATEGALLGYAASQLAVYKAPARVFILTHDEIPIGATRHVLRGALAARCAADAARDPRQSAWT